MMQTMTFRRLGTDCELAVDIDPASFVGLSATVRDWLVHFEQRFSRFRPDSELSRINTQAGEKISVSEPMWRMLKLAQKAQGISHGHFNPFILPHLLGAGYDASFESLVSDSHKVPATPLVSVPTQAIEFFPDSRQIRIPLGSMLDLGGIAKGVAADELAAILKQSVTNFWISLGGDMLMAGEPSVGKFWKVLVQNPHQLDVNLGELQVSGRADIAIATSGTLARHGVRGGRPWHHLIDPHTGKPSIGDLVSVTVLAAEVWLADILAKTVVIAGWDIGSQILVEAGAIAWLGVGADGHCRESARMGDYIKYYEPLT